VLTEYGLNDLGGGGLTPVFIDDDYTASAGEKIYVDSSAKAITVTLPAGSDADNIVIKDDGHSASINPITITPNGVETIDGDTSIVIDQSEGWCDAAYKTADTNWRVALSGVPQLINVNDFATGFSSVNAQTGTTYSFVESDLVRCVTANNAAASTYDIPDSLASDGETLNLLNIGAGEVTITVAGTDTLASSNNKCAQGKAITILCVGGNTWHVIGGSA
jgi:hypothetical protein